MRKMNLKKKKLEKQLNCVGFMGFGSGYGMAKGWSGKNGAVYCNICPARRECWEKHKERCTEAVPALVEEFEKMAKSLNGPHLVKAWNDKYGGLDPYLTFMHGNLEDGVRVAQGFQPKDREEFTLSWPLQERIQ